MNNNYKKRYVVVSSKPSKMNFMNKYYEYVDMENKVIDNVLNNRYKLLERGLDVVRDELKNEWVTVVNDLKTFNRSKLLYNAIILGVSLECMELLNKDIPVEEVYKLIDVYDIDNPCMYYGFKLTGWHNLDITNTVVKYHDRGKELEEYRNKMVYGRYKNISRVMKK